MRRIGSVLWPKLRVLQIYGANTGIGKTIVSTVLCRAFAKRGSTLYIKPVSTGPSDNADDRHVSFFAPTVQTKCLYNFADPVSPHIAARSAGSTTAIYDELLNSQHDQTDITALVETAGGVLSPTPSGSAQADLYRLFRFPVLLVGDHRLGGISATISAWESLHIRGYDVSGIALFQDGKYENDLYLKDYFADRNIRTISFAPPPALNSSPEEDRKSMTKYYDEVDADESIAQFVKDFAESHQRRIQKITEMPAEADEAIWHPFLQHRERSKDNIVAMDSAYGDYFQTLKTKQTDGHSSLLKPTFDGSASWWTQGLGHGNPQLALTAAYAAGRYGHVMFASAVHEPALTLAQTLINRMGNPRLSKVFYTDNGSTGMEVAIKMALRAASVRNKWGPEDDVLILGLTNSYHGDTIGTMDASEPNIFNLKTEWYRGRGHWFDFPQVKMRKGRWMVEMPQALKDKFGEAREFDSLEHIFDFKSRSEDAKLYAHYFQGEVAGLQKAGKKFGALVLEPILLGAGGMMLADPLFQRCLVEVARSLVGKSGQGSLDWSGIPVIFDEVFTGLYRLGRFSAASFLEIDPDIVVNAKLLTGGLLPLCTTTASQSIFDAFLSDDKSDALLHGHSYTAHAVGCAVANESLSTMTKLETSELWNAFRHDWGISTVSTATKQLDRGFWSMWSQSFVTSLSHKERVDHVVALGSVMIVSLKDAQGSGYASTAATGVRDRLLRGNERDEWLIHARVLGNVLYLMAAMNTEEETLRGVEAKVLAAID